MKKQRQKRGELTTTQLVTIIILIVSFVIILFLIFNLNLGGTADKEICRNSVILRDQSKIFAGPLDCKTNYLCISGGGDCSGISASEKVVIDLGKKEEIIKVIADEMASCWWQFGEDKELSYVGEPGLSGGVDCAVCSIVQFDEKIQQNFPKITYLEFYNYLEKTKKDSFQSYLKYLYGVSDIDALEIQKQFQIVDIKNDFFSTKEKYSIITGIDTSKSVSGLIREWFKVYIIPTLDTAQTACTDFITKA